MPLEIANFSKMANLFFTPSCDEISGTVEYSINRINLFSAATCNFCPIGEMSLAHWVMTFMSACQKIIITEDLTACLVQGKKTKPTTVRNMRSIW